MRSKTLGNSLHHWKNSVSENTGLRVKSSTVSTRMSPMLNCDNFQVVELDNSKTLLELDLGITRCCREFGKCRCVLFVRGRWEMSCVSLMTMEGAMEVKKAGVLPLIPFSGCGASLIQAANPFSCFNVAWF